MLAMPHEGKPHAAMDWNMSMKSMAVNSLKFGVWFVLAASLKIMCILPYFPIILRYSSFFFNIMYWAQIITMPSIYNTEFLKSSTTDILSWAMLWYWERRAVLCILEWSLASPAFTHQMPVEHHPLQSLQLKKVSKLCKMSPRQQQHTQLRKMPVTHPFQHSITCIKDIYGIFTIKTLLQSTVANDFEPSCATHINYLRSSSFSSIPEKESTKLYSSEK